MAVTQSQPVQVAPGVWQLGWSSDLGGTPEFEVYYQGQRILTEATDTGVVLLNRDTVEPPAVEVTDADTATPSQKKYSGRLLLQWTTVAGAVHYRIDELVGSTWTTRDYVSEDGHTYYHYETDQLADGSTAQWRIVPLDAYGREGTAKEIVAFIIRHPDPPAIAVTYDAATPKITVSAR